MRTIQRPLLLWLLILATLLGALTPRMHGMALPRWMTLGQTDLCSTQSAARDRSAPDGGHDQNHACVCLQCAVHTPGDLPPQSLAQFLPLRAQRAVFAALPSLVPVSATQWLPSQPRAPPVLA